MSIDRAFNVQRRERLMLELHRHGAVRVHELAELLQVSEITVRRDITALAQARLLTKVHGGAILPTALTPEPRRTRRDGAQFTFGMVVPTLDSFWPPVIAGARAAAAMIGVDLRLRGSSYDPEEDRRQIVRLVESGQAQGLLLAPEVDGDEDAEVFEWIGRLPVPSVVLERPVPSWTPTPEPIEWVRNDHDLGVETAVRHLMRHGHQRIGLVATPVSQHAGALHRGFRRACARLDLPDDLVFGASVRPELPKRRQHLAEILSSCRAAGATGLLVHGDPDAISIAQFCAEQGVVIPRDLALVSYGDEVAHLAEPPLTAIRPAKGHLGRAAVELLVARLREGVRRPVHRLLLAPELVVRGSTFGRD